MRLNSYKNVRPIFNHHSATVWLMILIKENYYEVCFIKHTEEAVSTVIAWIILGNKCKSYNSISRPPVWVSGRSSWNFWKQLMYLKKRFRTYNYRTLFASNMFI